MLRTIFKTLPVFVALAVLSACASVASSDNTTGVQEIYEVHEDGRIHVFYDYKMYKDFLSTGETPFRLIKVGKGPNRETMVFSLAKHDKNKGSGIPAIELYEGKTTADNEFYGEIRKHGRIYVFSDFKDMEPVRKFGHPDYFYMEIGTGPDNETVVYVLNKHTKKKKPVTLIEAFKNINKL